MGGVHVGHDAEIGNHAILANNTLLSGLCEGGGRRVPGRSDDRASAYADRALAITRGGTRLGKDVPPYFMAVDDERGERDQSRRVAPGRIFAGDAAR
jgi:UDP-N-acetylglucosamine acyltransferase